MPSAIHYKSKSSERGHMLQQNLINDHQPFVEDFGIGP